MFRRLLLSCIVLGVGSATAVAQQTVSGAQQNVSGAPQAAPGRAQATVRLAEPVLADGKPLPPGTYQVTITDERPTSDAGTPIENQRWAKFVQKGQVIAREIAEMFPAGERPVGTSGSSRASAVVQRLRGDEFVRIAVSDAGARYLIHLPTGRPPTEP